MAINWRRRETVFRLLAAVYAEMGEEAFKGRYTSIAMYFGPDATYDAVKSFFNKEISKAAVQLVAQCPDHRPSGRGVPPRRGPPQARPPFLYFDDEDISILTQREAEAHFNHSLRAPAKRPRVVAASPAPTPPQEGPLQNVVPDRMPPDELLNGDNNKVRIPSLHEAPAGPSSCPCPSSNSGPSSYLRANGQESHVVQEVETTSKKRPYSTLDSMMDSTRPQSPRPGDHGSPIPDSFGYVTNQGQFRCALCLSQLPNQKDLDRHEVLSKEHRRNLQNRLKVSKGREKLAQVTSIPPVPQPLSLYSENSGLEMNMNTSSSHDQTQESEPRPAYPLNQEESRRSHDTPSDTIEVLSYPATFACPPEPTRATAVTQAPQQGDPDHNVDKGKGRAASLLSLPSDLTPHQYPEPDVCLPYEQEHPKSLHTRPTTARTEIGSITASSTIDNRGLRSNDDAASLFSANEIAEILHSAELIKRVMDCVQKGAMANLPAAARSNENSSTDKTMPDAAPAAHVQSPKPTCIAPEVSHDSDVKEDIIQRHLREGRTKTKRTKDTGEDVFFIVLD